MRSMRAVFPVVLMLLSGSAEAQTRFYGEDNSGSESTRASNVNALAERDRFFSFLTGVGTETFEGLAASESAPLALAFPGAGTATLSGTGYVGTVGAGTNGFGRYPTSGANYWESTLDRLATFRVTFSDVVAAFGFYAVDLGDFGSRLTLQFYRDDVLVDAWSPYSTSFYDCPNRYCGSLKFIGVINVDTPFNEVRFLGSDQTDTFAFDDLTIGARNQVTVSEPSTAGLVLAGLLGLAALVGVGRRNQRRS